MAAIESPTVSAPADDMGLEIDFYNLTIHSIQVKNTPLRMVVGLSCALSIIGSLLIIFSYICFKNRRTKAREILVHISLMDLGVALANIIGLSVYFDRYYFIYTYNTPYYIENLCKTQAFFAGYSTLGSVFWTVSLMAYLYFRITHSHTKHALYFLRFCYGFCYGFPLLISLWLVLTGRLGYSPYDSAGWCTLITKDPLKNGKVDIFITLFGNELWIYLAFVLIPILYISIRLFVYNKVEATKKYANERQMWSALQNVDYKFLFIPIIFISLRIWTCIIIWITDFAKVKLKEDEWYTELLYYLSGIGDSSQGFANAILFVIFSKNVRESFKKCIQCKSSQRSLNVNTRNESGEGSRMLEPSRDSEHEAATTTNSDEERDMEKSSQLDVHSNYGTL